MSILQKDAFFVGIQFGNLILQIGINKIFKIFFNRIILFHIKALALLGK